MQIYVYDRDKVNNERPKDASALLTSVLRIQAANPALQGLLQM
jgi:predicted dienelactone hydrolase